MRRGEHARITVLTRPLCTDIRIPNPSLHSAAGAAQNSTSDTSTASTGAANSTTIATSAGAVSIVTNATVAAASNAQSIQNERQAAALTSCAADNAGASASAEEISTVTLSTANGTSVQSVAYAVCSAGVVAPSAGGSASASGSKASVGVVEASVTCDGLTSTVVDGETSYRVMVKGSYCLIEGFSGAVAGQRVASSVAEC